jgi:hypothetical protein
MSQNIFKICHIGYERVNKSEPGYAPNDIITYLCCYSEPERPGPIGDVGPAADPDAVHLTNLEGYVTENTVKSIYESMSINDVTVLREEGVKGFEAIVLMNVGGSV